MLKLLRKDGRLPKCCSETHWTSLDRETYTFNPTISNSAVYKDLYALEVQMAASIDIPTSLVSELWAWYNPHDKFASKEGRKGGLQLRPCHDLKKCVRTQSFWSKGQYKLNFNRNLWYKAAYEESHDALRSLKNLLRAVDALASVVRAGVKQMEKEILPVSRHRGIRSLPSELVVNIMKLVGSQPDMSRESFKSLMFMFIRTPPFNIHLLEAEELVERWEYNDRTWDGRLPPRDLVDSKAVITRFHFTMENNYSLTEVQDGLEPLKAL